MCLASDGIYIYSRLQLFKCIDSYLKEISKNLNVQQTQINVVFVQDIKSDNEI